MANIQPVEFPFSGVATKLNVIVNPFQTDQTSCSISYNLQTDDGKVVYNEFYQLTEEEFQGWGQDNSYIDEIAANLIPVVIIPEEPVSE